MTKEQRKRSKAFCEAATPGEWERKDTPSYAEIHNSDSWGKALAPIALVGHTEDADFIAYARTALPAALDALDEMDRKIKWAKEECPNGGNDGYITPRPCQCYLQSISEDRDYWKSRAIRAEADYEKTRNHATNLMNESNTKEKDYEEGLSGLRGSPTE